MIQEIASKSARAIDPAASVSRAELAAEQNEALRARKERTVAETVERQAEFSNNRAETLARQADQIERRAETREAQDGVGNNVDIRI
ncbi:MAG: hypothetical protein JJ902_17865 [Roseibium sp.]|nr:hypothetical protein [Roseibium sp.]